MNVSAEQEAFINRMRDSGAVRVRIGEIEVEWATLPHGVEDPLPKTDERTLDESLSNEELKRRDKEALVAELESLIP